MKHAASLYKDSILEFTTIKECLYYNRTASYYTNCGLMYFVLKKKNYFPSNHLLSACVFLIFLRVE